MAISDPAATSARRSFVLRARTPKRPSAVSDVHAGQYTTRTAIQTWENRALAEQAGWRLLAITQWSMLILSAAFRSFVPGEGSSELKAGSGPPPPCVNLAEEAGSVND